MDNNAQVNMDKTDAITRYLARGWALVPLHYAVHVPPDMRVECGCGDPGCRSVGKHPIARDWQINVQRTADAWTSAAGRMRNIGIVTGAPSGFWVLDYDPAASTRETLALIERLDKPHVRTGGQGWHWRFRMPADFEVTNRRGTLPAGLDVRGTGGQVVAPPSVSGKGAYIELTDAEPYEPPAWLLDMIRPAVHEPLRTRVPPAGWSPTPGAIGIPGPTGPGLAGRYLPSIGDRGQRYARAAVDRLLTELREATHNRNDLAYRAACRIIELINAGWLLGDGVYGVWFDATLAHPLGTVVPVQEVKSIWASATRRVGNRAAELPPAWADPFAVDALPPLPPLAAPPFASPNGAAPPIDLGDPIDPTVGDWETAVAREVNRELVHRAARERLRELDAGDRPALKARLRAETLDTAGLLARPPLVPLVAGLLYLDSLARLNGAPGAGKSFLALDLAARVAAGMPWAGRATTRVPVRYVVAEGDAGMRRRVLAWQARHGAAIEVRWLPRAVQIGGPEWAAWCEVLAEDGDKLIVLDTQARGTVGRNEIDGKDMGEVGAALDDLRQVSGACVLLVHHTPLGVDRARGHGSMTGALQTEWLVKKDGRVITLRSTKDKDDESPDDIIFDLVDVAGPDAGGMLADPVESIGVVPIWRGDPLPDTATAVARPLEPVGKTRARALWRAIHEGYGRSDGGTKAELRQAFLDCGVVGMGPNTPGFRQAWRRAWADLIQLGLVAKAYGAARYKVIVLADQSADGVLTSNRVDGGVKQEAPPGWEVILEDDTESK